MHAIPAGSTRARRTLFAILLIAIAARLPAAIVEMSHHADEIWQYLEQSYRMVTGRGIVPWEYRLGIRTYLLPVMFAPFVWAGNLLDGTPLDPLLPVRLFCLALSLGVVVAGYRMGRRVSALHATCAGLVLATSFELAYFSPRALSDGVAVPAFMLAAMLVTGRARDARRMFAAGLLLGLCFCIRFQLAPAIAVLVLGLLWRGGWRAVGMALTGGVAALCLDGLADLANGTTPFAWIVRNVHANIVVNRSERYGVEPFQWYVVNQARMWGPLVVPVALLAILGARHYPLLLAVAIVNVLFHSFVPHKEYRFVLLSVALALFLAGLGTADVLRRLSRRIAMRRVAVPAALLWVGVGIAAYATDAGRQQRGTHKKLVRLMRAAGSVPHACGLAFYQPRGALSAAYVYYRRDTPVFVFMHGDDRDAAVSRASTYNMIVTSQDRVARIAGGQGYRSVRCVVPKRPAAGSTLPPIAEQCLYVRPGVCTPAPDRRYDMNEVLVREDE